MLNESVHLCMCICIYVYIFTSPRHTVYKCQLCAMPVNASPVSRVVVSRVRYQACMCPPESPHIVGYRGYLLLFQQKRETSTLESGEIVSLNRRHAFCPIEPLERMYVSLLPRADFQQRSTMLHARMNGLNLHNHTPIITPPPLERRTIESVCRS